MSTDLLAGVRVLDLTNVLAGPYCCYQLALLGADVVKVEQPGGGDLARQLGASAELNRAHMGASFLAQNAGKRSVALDLKNEDGRARLLELVATADALVENFRPGVMDRLGLGYQRLKPVRPPLVYCAISGFGQTGPLNDNPAYDQIIQGLSGIMSITGTPSTAPLRVGYPVADTLGGLFGAFAVSAAPAQGPHHRRRRLPRRLHAGMHVERAWLAGLELPDRRRRAAADGQRQHDRSSLGRLSDRRRADQHRRQQAAAVRGALPTDRPPRARRRPAFAEREARRDNRAALTEAIEAELAAAPAASWEERMNRAGIPAGRVLTIPEVLDEPQVRDRAMTAAFPGVAGRDRPLTVVRGGFLVDGCPPLPKRPPPRLGEHQDEVLG